MSPIETLARSCPTRLHSAILLLFAAACSTTQPTGSDDWTRAIGTIAPEMSSIQVLQLPPTVTAGTPFTITVATVGSSSCTRAAGLEVSLSGLTADVTPYDSLPAAPRPCTRDLRAFPRSVSLTFAAAGTATIRLHGRQGDRTITYEAALTVRPRS